MPKIRAIIELDLTDEEGNPVDSVETLKDVARYLNQDIQNRLFGQGFLPAHLLVGTWTVNSEIVHSEVE